MIRAKPSAVVSSRPTSSLATASTTTLEGRSSAQARWETPLPPGPSPPVPALPLAGGCRDSTRSRQRALLDRQEALQAGLLHVQFLQPVEGAGVLALGIVQVSQQRCRAVGDRPLCAAGALDGGDLTANRLYPVVFLLQLGLQERAGGVQEGVRLCPVLAHHLVGDRIDQAGGVLGRTRLHRDVYEPGRPA